ncbi:MAG: hypothetical protein QNJ16_13245 [Rhodobacter sp.]|nr:hypothetical protein [Rhodobacter sp.]
MTDVPIANLGELVQCRSIAAFETQEGYTVAEAEDRFFKKRIAEAVFRALGLTLIVVGSFQWLLPEALLPDVVLVYRAVFTAVTTGFGFLLYFLGVRGFHKALCVDTDGRRISLARLNARGRSMVQREMPMRKIESLFVDRRAGDRSTSDLRVRLAGRPGSVSLMSGASPEIELLHRRLCLDIRLTLATAPVQPARVKRPAGRVVRLLQAKRRQRQAI